MDNQSENQSDPQSTESESERLKQTERWIRRAGWIIAFLIVGGMIFYQVSLNQAVRHMHENNH